MTRRPSPSLIALLAVLVVLVGLGGSRFVHADAISGTQYDVTCNGTDVTSTLQTDLNSISSAGGGTVRLSAGTCLVGQLTFDTNTSIVGEGSAVTILKRKNASNDSAVLVSKNFSTLTGTNGTGGVHNVHFAGFSIDGNKANQTGGNDDGVDVYGYEYTIDDVIIHHNAGAGFYSEWSTSGTASGNENPAATLTRVQYHDNNNGLYFVGPHDSMIDTLVSYNNTVYQVYLNTILQGANWHLWEAVTSGDPDFLIDSGASRSSFTNIEAEGAISAPEILVDAGEVHLAEAYVFTGGTGTGSANGIQIGDTGHSVGALRIDAQGSDWATGSCTINFQNDGGKSLVDAVTFTSNGGSDHCNTPNATTVYRHP